MSAMTKLFHSWVQVPKESLIHTYKESFIRMLTEVVIAKKPQDNLHAHQQENG